MQVRVVKWGSLALFFVLSSSLSAYAQSLTPQQEAKWMLERMTGIRWAKSAPELNQMTAFITAGKREEAARIAMAQPQFYNLTIKHMALLMSTREETNRIPFNDFAASFIGVARDETDARELLYGDFFYMADPSKVPTGVNLPTANKDLTSSNRHYSEMERNDLSFVDVLVRVNGQKLQIDDAGGVAPNPDPAGVLTSRTFLEAHATAGTNRRLVEYTFREFLCTPIDKWADLQAPDLRIGRDIDRAPAGDPKRFLSTCKSCHTVMDGFRGAFAKWDFDNGMAKNSGVAGTQGAAIGVDANKIVRKMNQNNRVYPGGFVTTDESWSNFAVRGVNGVTFGWRGGASSSSGVQSFGHLVANSERFSSCMAKRVFDVVCQRSIASAEEMNMVYALGRKWERAGYKFKKLFEFVVTHPNCRPQGEI